MSVDKLLASTFFRTWGFPFCRGFWRSRIEKSVAVSLDKRSRDACLNAVKKARTLNELLQKLIALGQEFEMSGSLASATRDHDTYETYLKTAARCYSFAFAYTLDEQLKEKMQRAEQEIEHRLEVAKRIYKR